MTRRHVYYQASPSPLGMTGALINRRAAVMTSGVVGASGAVKKWDITYGAMT